MGDEARDEALPMGENAAMESMTRLPRKSKLLLLHNLFFFKLKEIKNAVSNFPIWHDFFSDKDDGDWEWVNWGEDVQHGNAIYAGSCSGPQGTW